MNTHLLGKRVEIPVHTDAWMRGDRYGEITATLPCDRIEVTMDKSKRVISMNLSSTIRFV